MKRRLNIVSIDDSKAVHAFLGQCLTFHNVTHFTSGIEALDFLKTEQKTVDLVLLDWEMPVITGPEVLEQLKKHHPALPVIMLTSKNQPSDIRAMLEIGAVDYLLKPFTKDILQERIDAVLELSA